MFEILHPWPGGSFLQPAFKEGRSFWKARLAEETRMEAGNSVDIDLEYSINFNALEYQDLLRGNIVIITTTWPSL